MDAFDLDLATSLTYLFLQGATCSCERSMLAKFSTNTLDVHLQPGENQMNIKLATISVLAAAFVFVSDMAIAKSNQLTDDQVKQRIIDDSIASYPGTCACPFNTARNGSSCGRRSATEQSGRIFACLLQEGGHEGYGKRVAPAESVTERLPSGWASLPLASR